MIGAVDGELARHLGDVDAVRARDQARAVGGNVSERGLSPHQCSQLVVRRRAHVVPDERGQIETLDLGPATEGFDIDEKGNVLAVHQSTLDSFGESAQ